jgi:hypothetical protein
MKQKNIQKEKRGKGRKKMKEAYGSVVFGALFLASAEQKTNRR